MDWNGRMDYGILCKAEGTILLVSFAFSCSVRCQKSLIMQIRVLPMCLLKLIKYACDLWPLTTL